MSGELERARCDVDCDAGRRMGCRTFCCRLLVRLDPDEREPGDGVTPPKGFVDKDPVSGLCIHFDPDTSLCRNWKRRPRVCREYSCNPDPLLQVVLQHGFTSLAKLLKLSAQVNIPAYAHRRIPYIDELAPAMPAGSRRPGLPPEGTT